MTREGDRTVWVLSFSEWDSPSTLLGVWETADEAKAWLAEQAQFQKYLRSSGFDGTWRASTDVHGVESWSLGRYDLDEVSWMRGTAP